MSMFRIKNIRPYEGDKRVTLDAKHKDMMKEFQKHKKQLPELTKELETCIKELEQLENKNNRTKSKFNNDELNRKYHLEDRIKELDQEIELIQNNDMEYDYFLNTGHILFKYYDNLEGNIPDKENVNTNKSSKSSFGSSVSVVKNKTILDMFNVPTSKTENDNNTDKPKKKRGRQKITDFMTTKNSSNRADMLDEFLKIIDPKYVGEYKFDNAYDICHKCNVEKTLIQCEGILVCQSCGSMDHIIADSDKRSFKEPPPEVSYFAYRLLCAIKCIINTLVDFTNLVICYQLEYLLLEKSFKC